MKRSGGRAGGALAAVLAIGGGLGLAQCERPADPTPSTEPPPSLTLPAGLGRAGLLTVLSQASAAHAAGQAADDGAAVAGRAVEIRLPFGCTGPAAQAREGLAQWRRTTDGTGLVLSLTPADWTRSPLVLAPGTAPGWERAEGFWIARPWLTSDGCPRAPAAAPLPAMPAAADTDPEQTQTPVVTLPAPEPSPMTAGLVMFEGAGASRLGRRPGEPWRLTLRGTAERPVAAPADGYRLVLAGRIGRFPDGRTIRCTSTGPNVRPVCLAAVELDRVAFEDAQGGRLGEWRLT
ncbi:MAG: hypothetical protein KF910_07550 [Brevundimonas sp.]|uniref:hypothetical protein n=1 Tax=Brevundimonas sp. TaxID=1871086 RepID=UPI0025C111C5|nr:hypothetical protein [Brevundimonas sp.]MBX3477446.1 hypothetical protein [Brevundimonas sp.]